jgi:hypothetical protein
VKFASAAAFATSVAATTAAAAVSSDATSTTAAAAAAAVELPRDVARMIWQRKWRMEAAALIEREVRHAISSQWGVSDFSYFSQWGMPLLMDEMTAWMTVPVSQPRMRSPRGRSLAPAAFSFAVPCPAHALE